MCLSNQMFLLQENIWKEKNRALAHDKYDTYTGYPFDVSMQCAAVKT